MQPTRKTGLGDSLLLRRTEEPAPEASAVSADVPMASVSPAPESEPTVPVVTPIEPVLPRTTSTKKRKEQLVLRDRSTLYLERSVNEQLRLVARIEGRERSEVATDILRKYLPKYRIEREE
ncbi:MAG: hypothetical protein JWP89_370 [Schlesneria sp.]|nr:hypothetical protein [Schlesneria sp.]